MAMELTRKRIDLAGDSKTADETIEIIDLAESGQSRGTEVRFRLPLYV